MAEVMEGGGKEETYEEYLARQYAAGNVYSTPPAPSPSAAPQQAAAPPPPVEGGYDVALDAAASSSAAPTYTPQEQLAYDQGQAYQSGDGYSTTDGTQHPYNQQYQDVVWTGTPEEQLAYEQSQQYAMQNVHSTGTSAPRRYPWESADRNRNPPPVWGLPTAEETVNEVARATGQREMRAVTDGDGIQRWIPKYPNEYDRRPAWDTTSPMKDAQRPGSWADPRGNGIAIRPRPDQAAQDVALQPLPNPRSPTLDPAFGAIDATDVIRADDAYDRWLRSYFAWWAWENNRRQTDPSRPTVPPPAIPDGALFASKA